MIKLGIAFGGGGGRGAYQIGVWKALMQTGLAQRAEALSGTSVGALNGALFLQGTFERACQVWTEGLSEKILIPQPAAAKALSGLSLDSAKEFISSLGSQGVFSRRGLKQIIDDCLDLPRISASPLPFTVACVEAETNTVHYMTLNGRSPELIKKILCASSAIPLAFPPQMIEGRAFVDGGIPLAGDNCPIKPLAEAGCDTVIAIPLDRVSGIRREDFPATRIVEILPSKAWWGFASAIDGLLDFSAEAVLKRIALGYEDAMKILWQNHLTDIIAFSMPKKRAAKASPRSKK